MSVCVPDPVTMTVQLVFALAVPAAGLVVLAAAVRSWQEPWAQRVSSSVCSCTAVIVVLALLGTAATRALPACGATLPGTLLGLTVLLGVPAWRASRLLVRRGRARRSTPSIP